jgi:hypothetical protein
MHDQHPDSLDAKLAAQVEFTRLIAELRTQMAETVSGVVLRGARPVAVGITRGATKRPTTSAGALIGFALRNVSDITDANVTVYFHDGPDAGADVILAVSLAPGESARDWFAPGGIHLGDQGLYVEADGDIDGSVFLRGLDA